jgi:hypothetical protein
VDASATVDSISPVHDDPDFIEKLRERYGRQGIKWHIPGADGALRALETEHFEILITRVRFAIGQPNGAALARMARMKRPGTKVVFTATTENVEYTGLGEVVTAPVDSY